MFTSTPTLYAQALDTDGGGSLDRSEISRGLRDNGIWLFPDELIAFLDWLDKDGGGSVEIDELEEFWNEVKVKYDEDYDDYVEPGEEAVQPVDKGVPEGAVSELRSVDFALDVGSGVDGDE